MNRYFSSIIFLLILSISVYAQDKKLDKQPFPKGGMKAIAENVVYPLEAKQAGIEGKVTVEAVIDVNGTVISTKVLKSDNSVLNGAATAAVKKTSFTPGSVEGKPVKATVAVPIMFKLDNKKQK